MSVDITCSITEYVQSLDNSGAVISYKISLSCGGKTWEVKKRYSEFEAIQKHLSLSFGNLPALPGKSQWAIKKPEQIDARMRGLDIWAQAIIVRKDLYADSTFNNFFELEQNLPSAGTRSLNMIGQVTNNAMGYRDFIYLQGKRLMFTAIADMSPVSRIDSYFTNMDLPWEKKNAKQKNQVQQSVGVIEAQVQPKKDVWEFERIWCKSNRFQAICLAWSESLGYLVYCQLINSGE